MSFTPPPNTPVPNPPPAPSRDDDKDVFDGKANAMVAWYATAMSWFTSFFAWITLWIGEVNAAIAHIDVQTGLVDDDRNYVASTINTLNTVTLPLIDGKVTTATGAATTATNKAADAMASATMALNLAQQESGNVPGTTKKSAYAYAVDAKYWADQAAAIVGPTSWTSLTNRPAQLLVADGPEAQTRTAAFTAVAGGIYTVDTTAGSIDIQFPAPAANTNVAPIQIYDVAKKFATNTPRALPGAGQKIDGVAEPFRMDVQGRHYTFVWFPHISNWSFQA